MLATRLQRNLQTHFTLKKVTTDVKKAYDRAVVLNFHKSRIHLEGYYTSLVEGVHPGYNHIFANTEYFKPSFTLKQIVHT